MSVYVIGTPERGLQRVKVGFTDSSTERRLAELQTSCPFKLEVLAVADGNRQTERLLHMIFGPRRVHGEWFDFGDDDPVTAFRDAVQLIADARSGVVRVPVAGPQIADLAQKAADRRNAVVAALLLHGPLSGRSLSRLSGVPAATIYRDRDEWVAAGLITVGNQGVQGGQLVYSVVLDHSDVATLLP